MPRSAAAPQNPPEPPKIRSDRKVTKLECRKWGFKRWGFKEIRGYLRKRAFFLRFLDFPGALRTLRKRAKRAEKGRKKADFGRFPGRAARHPLSPHLLHPHLRQPKKKYTPPPRDPSFLGLSPDPEVTEQKKLWCIPFSWENKGKGYTP